MGVFNLKKMNKHTVEHPYNGISLSDKNKWAIKAQEDMKEH